MTRTPGVRLALVPFTMLLLSACGLQEGLDQGAGTGGASPSQAPVINGTTLAGRPLSWSSLRGHAVVLDFWASWCGHCRAEQTDLNRLYQQYARRGVLFLGIDVRDDNDAAVSYQRDLGVVYPSVVDSTEQISAAYDVSAPPTVILINQRGSIAGRFLGTVVGVSDELNRVL